ncbi:MAG: RnfABCDGE type electron transport complex subunit D, partial [Chlorobiales bacterium]|nr:RnfABCDGE type electron transport complex subunit D [Chlorobiales bacterium]
MKLVVSLPPHALAKHSLKSFHLTWLGAMIPAAAAGVYFYGLTALLVLALTTLTAILTEGLISRIINKPSTLGDAHAALLGLTLGLTLSPIIPWWTAVIASLIMIILAKAFFGGLAFYPFHP